MTQRAAFIASGQSCVFDVVVCGGDRDVLRFEYIEEYNISPPRVVTHFSINMCFAHVGYATQV